MSATATVQCIGFLLLGGWIYHLQPHRRPPHTSQIELLEKEKNHTKELEEEIVRLKREMRICKIYTQKEDTGKEYEE